MSKRFFIILFFIPYLVSSQDNLSLKEAIQLGLKQNFDILISQKELKINKITNNWTNAGALPTINLSSRAEKNISDQSDNPTSFIQETLKSEAIIGSANLSWTLFNGFAIRANKERLKQLENLSNGNLTLTIENTIQGIILSYYNCVLQKERVELLQKVVSLLKSRLDYEKTKYEIGIISKIDLLQIENALLTDSSNLILQQLNFTNSVKNLNLTLGINIEKRWYFTDEIDTEIKLYNFESLKESTLSNNSNIKNQYFNIQLSKQDIKLSKVAFYPLISLNSGASYNQSNYDIGDSEYEGSTTGKSINYFANFSVNFRLFDGWKLYNTLKKVKLQKEVNELKLEKIKEEVTHQLSLTNDKYNSRISVFNLNKKAFVIADINYQLANDKKNRGVINSFMLRDIEIAFINSGISYQQAAYNLMESKIALLKITGGILQEDF